MTKLHIEYEYDDESHSWGYVVPSLHITGSSDTRDDAEREAAEAIEFTVRYMREQGQPLPEEIAEERPLPHR